MDIEPADTEGVHGGAPRRPVGMRLPGQWLTGHPEGAAVPIKFVVELSRRCSRRDQSVLHGEHHLDEAGDARRLECVADVCLHASNRDLPARRQVTPHQPCECCQFGGVAHLRARGVGLDVFDPRDVGRVGIRPLDGEHLPLLPRSPQALSFAVAGHAEAADHRPDSVTVGDRLRQLFDHQGYVALGGHKPVGFLAEWAGARVTHRLGGGKEHEAV